MKRTGENSSCPLRAGLLWGGGVLVVLGVILGLSGGADAQEQAAPQAYVFEPLPYAYDALEPHIDARTMEIHYDRHHRAYHANLLRAAEGAEWAGTPLEEIFPLMSRFPEAVRNNGGGHYNHTLFWEVMSPDGGGAPPPELAERIDRDLGSFEAFKEQFTQAALTRFGSGWAWLCVDADGTLFVTSTPNQDNPLMDVVDRQGVPILTLDVWEHAYYLKYQNQRGSYIDAFWNVVNWPRVVELLRASGR